MVVVINYAKNENDSCCVLDCMRKSLSPFFLFDNIIMKVFVSIDDLDSIVVSYKHFFEHLTSFKRNELAICKEKNISHEELFDLIKSKLRSAKINDKFYPFEEEDDEVAKNMMKEFSDIGEKYGVGTILCIGNKYLVKKARLCSKCNEYGHSKPSCILTIFDKIEEKYRTSR
jgi:hypothetical protein